MKDIFFLSFQQLCYLDRVIFKIRDVPRLFPTYKGWTSKVVCSRVNRELSAVGKFGCGIVVSRIAVDAETSTKRNAPVCGTKHIREEEEGCSSQIDSKKMVC